MKNISAAQLNDLLENEHDLNIIDVREGFEIEVTGIIPGANHIPLAELPEKINSLDKGKEFILVCRSGGRSHRACEYLEAQGFKTSNLTGGMLDWNYEVNF